MSQRAVGDRVVIRRPGQPWHGHSGSIIRAFPEQGLDWIVELDDPAGHTSGCADRHLQTLAAKPGPAKPVRA